VAEDSPWIFKNMDYMLADERSDTLKQELIFDYAQNATVYYASGDSLNGQARKSSFAYNVTS
jgi:hypothetical protein